MKKGCSYLGHVMHQQQGDGDGRDVMRAADLQDVPQAHDGGVARRDVARADVVVHTHMKDNVSL